MLRISFLLSVVLSVVIISSCGNTSKEQATDVNQTSDSTILETTDVEAQQELEEVIDFTKFEHYASIANKEELSKQFGEANLTDAVLWYAEGTVQVNTSKLTNPDTKHVIVFVWDDADKTSSIEAHYTLRDKDFMPIGTQKIACANGLTLGMTIAEINAWNDGAFKFSGFGWDQGGFIHNDENSNLGKSSLTASLALQSYEGAEWAMGDIALSSTDERLGTLDIVLGSFTMYIE